MHRGVSLLVFMLLYTLLLLESFTIIMTKEMLIHQLHVPPGGVLKKYINKILITPPSYPAICDVRLHYHLSIYG